MKMLTGESFRYDYSRRHWVDHHDWNAIANRVAASGYSK
jgi:hypothetical protein